jgi:hypothetical protein
MPTKHAKLMQSVAITLAICIAGCSESTVEPVRVAGMVLIDAKPLDGGTISFVPKVGRPASSTILPDGSFDMAAESIDRTSQAGVMPGIYRVQVSASKIVDDQTIEWKAPQHYADFRTSGLEVVVERPVSDLVFELTSEVDEAPGAADDSSPDTPTTPSASDEVVSPEDAES